MEKQTSKHKHMQSDTAFYSMAVKPKLLISPFMPISCGSEATVLKQQFSIGTVMRR
jgi:hypothetical protein